MSCLRWLLGLGVVLLGIGDASPGWAARRTARIAMVTDGPVGGTASFESAIQQEVQVLLQGQYEVVFVERPEFRGDWTRPGVTRALDAAYADRDVDVVLTTGLIGSSVAGGRDRFPKKTVACAILDPEGQGVPSTPDGTSGVEGFTYVAFPEVFRNDIRIFERMYDFEHLALLMTDGLAEAVPAMVDHATRVVEEFDARLTPIPVQTVEGALQALPEDVDAVYVLQLVRLEAGALEDLAEGLAERRLPSFTLLGPESVRRGFLASTTEGLDAKRVARRIAIIVQGMLSGRRSSEMKTVVGRRAQPILNMAVARQIGFDPTFDILTEAELLNPIRDDDEFRVDIRTVVAAALAANLDFEANRYEVEAGQQRVANARSRVLPDLSFGARGAIIDDDRAAAGFGGNPERSLAVQGSLRQLLYSDDAYSELKIQKYLQQSREFRRNDLALDTMFSSSTAYLDVLRAMTRERIQRSNLGVTQENLKLAEVRVKIGVAGPSEVYRLQSQLAQNQAAVIEAVAFRNNAEIELNRVMNRKLEAPLSVASAEADGPMDELTPDTWRAALSTPGRFRVLRQVVSEVGVELSPALEAVDAQIGSSERAVTNANRAWFIPDFSAEADLSHRILEGGAGAPGSIQLPTGSTFPVPDDTNWTLALVAQYPLFEGLNRLADAKRTRRELSQQQIERMALAQRIDQQVRTALHNAGASFVNIRLQRQSAEAARKNLQVVQDSYGQGALSYLNVIDAQDAALEAELQAANAVFDFLSDLMAVYRAMSFFPFMEPEDRRDAIKARIESALTEALGRPPETSPTPDADRP